MKRNLFLIDKLFKFLKVNGLVLFTLFFTGCFEFSTTDSDSSVSSIKEPTYSSIHFDELNELNISITSVSDGTIAYKTKSDESGFFIVDINSSYMDEELMLICIENSKICTYATVLELEIEGVNISPLTTLSNFELLDLNSSSQIISKLSEFTKKIVRLSINDDNEINYKDLNAFIPNKTADKKFINPNIYEQMKSSGFIDAILNNDNLSSFINVDLDNDGLDWEEELISGSSVNSNDSDGDGVLDSDEIIRGTDPTNNDTDFDGISDLDEINGVTDPTKSDSDGDYLSDSFEIVNGMDPLNSDENSNGILDGLDGDPLFKYQWHLKSNGDVVSNTNDVSSVIGNDLGVLEVYRYQRGDINDTEIGHGTAVAGIIGAIANNGIGLRGVVPFVKIAGSNWLEEQSILELDKLWYNSPGANEILVSNNSWGAYMSKDKSFEDIMRLASEELRDGKGRVFTFASGNDRKVYGNANLSYIANNRYAITVASLTHENKYSDYSNPGSNLLVSGYGGSSYEEAPTIATTLLMGKSYYQSELGSALGAITFDDDYSRSYSFSMNGTSAATPMVSGAIALTLESCPDLTWRDIRWLLSYTSKKIDNENEFWEENTAKRSHNINYGYGLIDTDSMIKECRSKYYTLLPKEISASISIENANVYIADNNQTHSILMNFPQEFTIEWVELTLDSNHPYAGDYEVSLISPSGTKTQIVAPNELRSDYYKGGFRFSSAAFMGESSVGVWKVEVVDRLKLDSGTVTSLDLKIYGHDRS